MKNIRKSLAMFLAAVMLTGCGAQQQEKSQGEGTLTTQTDTAATSLVVTKSVENDILESFFDSCLEMWERASLDPDEPESTTEGGLVAGGGSTTEPDEPTEPAEPDEPSGVTPSGATGSHAVFVYMIGSDLESQDGVGSLDIEEMIDSDFDDENLTVLLCTGGAKRWSMDEIDEDAYTIFEVTPDGLVELQKEKKQNMGEAESLTKFLDYGYDYCDADSYGLVMWDHGGGAVLGFGGDENYHWDTLLMPEMQQAFSDSKLIQSGNKFEWIGFDACLMGMLEIADVLQPYANYMIASEEMEAGCGWNYYFLQPLADGKLSNGKEIGSCIVDYYAEYMEELDYYEIEYSLSCLELSRTDDVVDALEQFILQADAELQNRGYSKLARKRNESKTFGYVTDEGFYDIVDLYDLAENMKEYYPEQAEELQGAVSDFVVYERTNIEDAYGVAVFFPYENKEDADEFMELYEDIKFNEEYTEFLVDFTTVLSGEELASWNTGGMTPIEDDINAGQYYIQLSQEEMENYATAQYTIWERIEDEGQVIYTCWLKERSPILTDDGKLSSDFSGELFYISNGIGDEIPCTAYEIERTSSYVKYCIMMFVLNPEALGDPDGEYMKSVSMHVRYNLATGETDIVGVYEEMEDGETLPSKEQVVFEQGQYLQTYIFARTQPTEDAPLTEWQQWESASYLYEMSVEGDITVTRRGPDETTEYQCMFQIEDTQGNAYFTNPITIEK